MMWVQALTVKVLVNLLFVTVITIRCNIQKSAITKRDNLNAYQHIDIKSEKLQKYRIPSFLESIVLHLSPICV